MPLALLSHYTVRALGPYDREAVALTDIDHVSHVALAAVDESDGSIVAVARYNAWARREGVADLAVAVIDDWQGRRLGTRLAIQAIQRAKLQRASRC